MNYVQVLHSLARVWFAVTLIAALMFSFLSLEANAQDQDRTQTSGGRPANPRQGTATGAAIGFNPENFVELYSESIRQQSDQGLIPEVIGRDTEAARARNALQEKGRVAIVHGDAKAGKSALIIKLILGNRNLIVYRLRIDKIYELESKEKQAEAIKTVIRHLENLALQNTTSTVAFYIDNVPFLAEGHQHQIKPIGALTEAIAANRRLPMILEMDPTTANENFTNSKVIGERITAIEVKAAPYDAVVYHLRTRKAQIQRDTGASVSDAALGEAARIALDYKANKPFEFAEMFVRHAAQRLHSEQNAGITEAGKLHSQIRSNEATIASLQDDLKHEHSPEIKQQLQTLRQQNDQLQARKNELTIPAASSEVEINIKKDQLKEQEDRLKIMESGRGVFQGFNTRLAKEKSDLNKEISDLTIDIRRLERDQSEIKATPEKPASRVAAKQIHIAAGELLRVPPSVFAVNLDEAIKEVSSIKQVVRNQAHIIDRIALALSSYKETQRREAEIARLQSKEPKKRPIYTALLAGESGTGKTEIVKQLALKLGIPEADIVRLDMTEYMEKHAVSRLISAPPGYIGYDQPGQLTGPVNERPFRIILVDEVEKGHPDAIKIFMQVLDDARLTDGSGRTVFFDKTIIIFTTNAGERFTVMNREQLLEVFKTSPTQLSPSQLDKMSLADLRSEAVKIELRGLWGTALVNRFNDVMTTNSHTPQVVEQILHDQFKRFAKDIRDIDGVRLVISEAALYELFRSYNPTEGARSIVNTMKREVIDPVNFLANNRRFSKGDVVLIDFQNRAFDFAVTANEHYVRAMSDGDRVRLEKLEEIKVRLAKQGKEVTPETRPQYFRMFDPEYMVRNATAKTLKLLGRK